MLPKSGLFLSPKVYLPAALVIIIVAFFTIKPSMVKTTRDNQQLANNDNENSAEYQYVNSLIDNGDIDESLLVDAAAGIDDTSKNNNSSSELEKNISDMNISTVVLNDTVHKVVITDDDIIQYLLDNSDEDDLINNN